MLKEYKKDLKMKKILAKSPYTIIYELCDGRVFKEFTSEMLFFMYRVNFPIENRINQATPISNVKEILIPTSSVYEENNHFIGYTEPKAKGMQLSKTDFLYTFKRVTDLNQYTEEYLKLEEIVKRANEQGIVFPDLLTVDNIFIDKYGNYQFIDYEGIQIQKNHVMGMSTSLGNEELYENPKYKKSKYLYTTNLDKKSLLYYYFLETLNVNLANVGIPNTYGEPITLEEVFYQINLHDYDFMQKIYIALKSTGENAYIGEDVKRMNEKYTLEATSIGNHMYLKRYRKK